MKLDVIQVITDLDGCAVKVAESRDGETKAVDLTLRKALTDAVMANHPLEQPSGEEKFKRYQLAQKIHKERRPEMSVEELAKLKELVGKYYAPIVVGRVYEMIEQQPPEKAA